jgi:hypothetical protein
MANLWLVLVVGTGLQLASGDPAFMVLRVLEQYMP